MSRKSRILAVVFGALVLAVPMLALAGQGEPVRVIVRAETGLTERILVSYGCTTNVVLSDAVAATCPSWIARLPGVEKEQFREMLDDLSVVQINAPAAWSAGFTGSGVVIAELDTGVEASHPALAGAIVGGYDYVSNKPGIPADKNGHGTHVAGIVTADAAVKAQAQGVAQSASLWVAKVCSGICPDSAIAAAIDYVVANKPSGARVITMSIGGGLYTTANCDTTYLAGKVNAAVAAGITMIIAAGNNAGGVSSPGCASKAISVGAVQDNNVVASFSGRGPALKIVAPGVGIYSSYKGGVYKSLSGTSMATPGVAGVVALMLQKNPLITDAQIKNCLYTTTTDLGAAGYDTTYGNGLVNAGAAVACA